MGLETEYAIRCKPTSSPGLDKGLDFHRFISALSHEVPTAPSFRNAYRFFLANGGCVSLEHGSSAKLEHSLFESATPECRSPRELLCHQMAIEKLVAETIQSTFAAQEAQVLKGSFDAHGHTFGQHESYEVRIAQGLSLLGWRLGLLLLFPILVLYRFAALCWLLLFWSIAKSVLQVRVIGTRLRTWFTKKNAGEQNEEATQHPAEPLVGMNPVWVDRCAAGLRLLHIPVAWGLSANIYCFALLEQRRHLTAFFASRCIVDGAGFLDEDNRYWVSSRAAMVNSIIGFGSYRRSRPIFRCDSWLRSLCTETFLSYRQYAKLFSSTQRIEIAIGDSGLCEQAQYVRLGATSLVFDLLESGSPRLPRLRKPLAAIVRFARDWMLLTTVPDRSQRQWSALDIQHAYAAAVRQMLQTKSTVPIEAWKILDQWQTTLNQLMPTDDEANVPRTMLGRIDWLSKLWLLHQMKNQVSWQRRKKIDLRYHELSREGYHYRLMDMLCMAPLIDPSEVVKARRTPPSGTPAMKRGYLIREFSDSESQLHVDWTHAEFLLEGKRTRVKF